MTLAETVVASAPVQQAVCDNKQIYCWRSNTLAGSDIGCRNSGGFDNGTMSGDGMATAINILLLNKQQSTSGDNGCRNSGGPGIGTSAASGNCD